MSDRRVSALAHARERALGRLRPLVPATTTRLQSLLRGALDHPPRALAIGAAVVVVAVVAALQLSTPPASGLLTDPHKGTGAATRDVERSFGGEPIIVVVRGDLQSTLAPSSLLPLLKLEGQLAMLPGVRSVFGPGTFINETIIQTDTVISSALGPAAQTAQHAADQARRQGLARHASPKALQQAEDAARIRALGPTLTKQYEDLLVRFGYLGAPSLSNGNFISALVYGPQVQPKQRFRWLFADNQHALILVRPNPGLSDASVRELGRTIRADAAGAGLKGGQQLDVAGAPLVAAAVSRGVRDDLRRLAPAVLLAMMVALLVGFRAGRSRLRVLALAGASVAITEGLAWPLGLDITPATVAALPVILGLSVDFAVQLQARYWSERARGLDPRGAAERATRALAPVLALSGGAMTLGFLALTLSGVPLVAGLGRTLALGTLVSLAVVLGLGGALMSVRERGGARAPLLSLPGVALRPRERTAALLIAAALAVAGLAVSGQAHVQSDITKLAPPSLGELRAVESVQRQLGTAGQIRIDIRGRDLTDPAAVEWIYRVGNQIQGLDRRLRPGPNLGQLLGADQGTPTRSDVNHLVSLVPTYFLDAVLSRNHTRAELSYGVPLESIARQGQLLRRIAPLLRTAPPGVRASSAGLIADASAGVDDLQAGRPWLLLLSVLLVFSLLVLAGRPPARAAIPLVPALLVAGISALVFVALGLQLSPLSASLEPLVLAVGVEFGLLLEARYWEERRRGASIAEARAVAVRRVGAAVSVSAGAVALAFAVLAASRLDLLRQFGLLVAGELVVCALVCIGLVPALCELVDRMRRARPPAVQLAVGEPRLERELRGV